MVDVNPLLSQCNTLGLTLINVFIHKGKPLDNAVLTCLYTYIARLKHDIHVINSNLPASNTIWTPQQTNVTWVFRFASCHDKDLRNNVHAKAIKTPNSHRHPWRWRMVCLFNQYHCYNMRWHPHQLNASLNQLDNPIYYTRCTKTNIPHHPQKPHHASVKQTSSREPRNPNPSQCQYDTHPHTTKH